jgi:hypothetical protein
MAFDTQIQDLVGTGFTDQTAMDAWMSDGVKEVINAMPIGMLELCSSTQSFTSTVPGSESEVLNTGKISNITLNSEPCRRISPVLKHRVSDSDDMNYATLTDPVYYIEANKINALPSEGSCKYSEVQYTSVNASADSAIANFPDEAEYLTVLYASIKALQQQMNSKSADLPSDVSAVVLAATSESLPSFTAPDSYVLVPPPAGVDVDFSSVPSSPVFIKQSLTLSNFPSMVWSFPAVPTAPSILENFITVSGTAPTYSSPVLSPDFSQVDTYIDTDEDNELATAKLQQIQTQVQEFSSRLQDGVNKFNKENIEYQASLQIDIQNAQIKDSNENKKLQKYQNEISSYGAEVNKVASENQGKVSEWQQKNTVDIQKYSTDIQNETSRVSFENSVFSQEVQKAIQKYQSETGYDLTKYSAEVQSQSQRFTGDLQKNTDTFRTSMEKYTNEYRQVTSKNNDIIAQYNSDIQNYNAKIQKQGIDYQWLLSQHQQLSADYIKGIQILQSGTLPQQQ